jgi:hypothetical protein
MGHPPDKCEMIILGGTWDCYGLPYREDFITRLFYACNVYHRISIRMKGASIDQKILIFQEMKTFLIVVRNEVHLIYVGDEVDGFFWFFCFVLFCFVLFCFVLFFTFFWQQVICRI